jgi:uncharacterized surface protein with fasciclin (FAS1) repeats
MAHKENKIMSKLLVALVALFAVACSTTNKKTETADNKPTADIVDTAIKAGSFNTLVAAIQAAGLEETLRGTGPFTVFAPTDAAFAKLPAGTVEALLQDKAKLTQILTYHVVAGEVLAKDVVKLTSAKTVEGREIRINTASGVKLNETATVTATDIKTKNGVIHIIDTVLIP